MPLKDSGRDHIGSDQQQFALRKINHFAGLEDNGKAQPDERIDTTLSNASKEQLNKIRHGSSCTVSWHFTAMHVPYTVGPAHAVSRFLSELFTQIRFNHVRVSLDLRRCSLSNGASEIENQYAVGNAHPAPYHAQPESGSRQVAP